MDKLAGILFFVGLFSIMAAINTESWTPIIYMVGAWGAAALFMYLHISNEKERTNEEENQENARLEDRDAFIEKCGLSHANRVELYKSIVLCIDNRNKNVAFLYRSTEKKYEIIERYKFEDVIEAEIVVDGNTLTKTSRGSQISGALIGGAIAGGMGAVIGGLSGKTTSDEQISTIKLKITVNDKEDPVKQFYFLNEQSLPKNDPVVISNHELATTWHGHFAVIMNEVAKQLAKEQPTPSTISETATQPQQDKTSEPTVKKQDYSELRDLHQLMKEGIISEEEFVEKKKKILG